MIETNKEIKFIIDYINEPIFKTSKPPQNQELLSEIKDFHKDKNELLQEGKKKESYSEKLKLKREIEEKRSQLNQKLNQLNSAEKLSQKAFFPDEQEENSQQQQLPSKKTCSKQEILQQNTTNKQKKKNPINSVQEINQNKQTSIFQRREKRSSTFNFSETGEKRDSANFSSNTEVSLVKQIYESGEKKLLNKTQQIISDI